MTTLSGGCRLEKAKRRKRTRKRRTMRRLPWQPARLATCPPDACNQGNRAIGSAVHTTPVLSRRDGNQAGLMERLEGGSKTDEAARLTRQQAPVDTTTDECKIGRLDACATRNSPSPVRRPTQPRVFHTPSGIICPSDWLNRLGSATADDAATVATALQTEDSAAPDTSTTWPRSSLTGTKPKIPPPPPPLPPSSTVIRSRSWETFAGAAWNLVARPTSSVRRDSTRRPPSGRPKLGPNWLGWASRDSNHRPVYCRPSPPSPLLN
ncbi:unnamed protein product [Protopolystoma xenopodis]|uniref:Uncharacterized protein n=1 Tax=Protopolystoma xenopodis TaxID=117903 RepID=A0A3S5CH98_9PLAT|nr:unnamed protein product [Protopolystoma xenopodis]